MQFCTHLKCDTKTRLNAFLGSWRRDAVNQSRLRNLSKHSTSFERHREVEQQSLQLKQPFPPHNAMKGAISPLVFRTAVRSACRVPRPQIRTISASPRRRSDTLQVVSCSQVRPFELPWTVQSINGAYNRGTSKQKTDTKSTAPRYARQQRRPTFSIHTSKRNHHHRDPQAVSPAI